MRLAFVFILFCFLAFYARSQNCDPRHTPISQDEAWRISGMKACCEAEEGRSPFTFSQKLSTDSSTCHWILIRRKKKKGNKRFKVWKQRIVQVDAKSGHILARESKRLRIKTEGF